MKSGFYMTTGDNQFSSWTEKKLQSTSQSQTCTKKIGSWSLFGSLLPVGFTTAFWIPVKSLHLRSMLSKLMRCTENCNTCSQYWSTEGAQLFSAKMLDCISHNQCFKNGMNWTTEFCFICHIHLTSRQPTTTSSSILTTFCMENVSMTSNMQNCLSTVHQIPKHGLFFFFFAIGINKLISHWQKWFDCNVSYFD